MSHCKPEEVAVVNMRLPKQSTVANVLEDLRSKVSRPMATLHGVGGFGAMKEVNRHADGCE